MKTTRYMSRFHAGEVIGIICVPSRVRNPGLIDHCIDSKQKTYSTNI